MSFNLLNKTLVTTLDDAAEAAQKLISIVTPENSVEVVGIAERFGLGISQEIKTRSDAMAMAELEAEETPNLEEVA